MNYEMLSVSNAESDVGDQEAPLTAEDRAWMTLFGCEWPNKEHERMWLDELNQVIEVGSVILSSNYRIDQQLARNEVDAARKYFFDLLPACSADVITGLDATKAEHMIPTARFIGLQREFHARGINGLEIFAAHPSSLNYSRNRVAEWVRQLDADGVNGAKLVQDNPNTLRISAGLIIKKREAWREFISSTGSGNSNEIVNKLTDQFVASFSISLNKITTIAQVIREIMPAYVISPDDINSIRGLCITPIEDTIAAALLHRHAIRSPAGLRYQAAYIQDRIRDGSRSKGEILGFIANADPDDPIVSKYLEAFPIDNLEAVKAGYSAGLEERLCSSADDVPLLSTGPLMLGDPGLTAFNAYKVAVDVPELDDEQFATVSAYISDGLAAEATLRRFDIKYDDDDIDTMLEKVEVGKKARMALVTRYLGMVMRIAEGSRVGVDRSEVVGVGNTVLSGLIMRDYNPEDESCANRKKFERLVLSTILDALIGFGPRYQGKSLHQLQKQWSAEDAMDSRVSSGSDS